MSLFGKLFISLIVAAIASAITVYAGSHSGYLTLFAAFSAATIVTSLLGSIKAPGTVTAKSSAPKAKKSKPKAAARPSGNTKPKTSGGKREEGEVKWFNVSKGFGFISRESGEEIFVHFRSILGEGRRSLRDGQRVSFVVADSDKGLQAEEVEAID